MRYVVFLKGINVAEKKRVPMNDLKSLMINFNFKNITTILESGNIVFDNIQYQRHTIPRIIRGAIKDCFDYDIPVFLHNHNSLKNIIKNNPFLQEENINKSQLYITFLEDIPPPHKIKHLASHLGNIKDRYQIIGKYLYIHLTTTYVHTKLSNRTIEKRLDIVATTRKWETIEKLVVMSKMNIEPINNLM